MSSTSADWEPFDHLGRPFLRAALPEARGPNLRFTIAREVAGRYQVEDLLATSGMNALLRAHDLRTGRGVVLKALRSDALAEPPEGSDRIEELTAEVRRQRHLLQTERRLLVRLRNSGCDDVPHPNDYVFDSNPALADGWRLTDEALIATEPYLVLEYVAGRTLADLLESEFPQGLEEVRALELMAPIVAALEVLHQPWRLQSGRMWHCVYQDLKPGNILVDPTGRPRLIDFGGCQVVIDGVPVLEGAHTPGYSAPECEGPGPARVLLPGADVYSLGCTFYHLLTGIDPRGRTGFGNRGANPGSPDLRALESRCSPGTRDLVRRCLAVRPSDRLANASRVAEALAPLIGTTRDLPSSP